MAERDDLSRPIFVCHIKKLLNGLSCQSPNSAQPLCSHLQNDSDEFGCNSLRSIATGGLDQLQLIHPSFCQTAYELRMLEVVDPAPELVRAALEHFGCGLHDKEKRVVHPSVITRVQHFDTVKSVGRENILATIEEKRAFTRRSAAGDHNPISHAILETAVTALARTLIVLVALAPAVAYACGPTRHKETTAIQIDAPADKVWAIVGNYGDMNWNAAVAKTEATVGSVPDVSKRMLTLKSGKVLTEVLTAFDPAEKTISFMTDGEDTSALPVRGYNSKITVRDSSGKAIVEWRGAFASGYAKNEPPAELNDEAAIKAFAVYQNAALASLKLKIESGS